MILGGIYFNFQKTYTNWLRNKQCAQSSRLPQKEHLDVPSAPFLYVPPALSWILPNVSFFCDEQPNAKLRKLSFIFNVLGYIFTF